MTDLRRKRLVSGNKKISSACYFVNHNTVASFDISGHSGVDPGRHDDDGQLLRSFWKADTNNKGLGRKKKLCELTFFQLEHGYMLGLFHALITPCVNHAHSFIPKL